MVKSVLGVNHQGLREWFLQRITAIVMIIYVLGVVGFLICHPQTSYDQWRALFGHFWMKLGTVLVMLSLLYHAWIGMWTVYTDYIKITWLNMLLQVLTVLALIALFFETLQIVWSV